MEKIKYIFPPSLFLEYNGNERIWYFDISKNQWLG